MSQLGHKEEAELCVCAALLGLSQTTKGLRPSKYAFSYITNISLHLEVHVPGVAGHGTQLLQLVVNNQKVRKFVL